MINIDFSKTVRPVNPIHGVGNGPACTPFKRTMAQEFMDAGIPFQDFMILKDIMVGENM